MANGLGSRNRARVATKSNQLPAKHDDDMVEKDSEVHEGTSHASSSEISQDLGSRKQIPRSDDISS